MYSAFVLGTRQIKCADLRFKVSVGNINFSLLSFSFLSLIFRLLQLGHVLLFELPVLALCQLEVQPLEQEDTSLATVDINCLAHRRECVTATENGQDIKQAVNVRQSAMLPFLTILSL